MPGSTDKVSTHPHAALSRILGLAFSLAVIFGGTVGVGILRLPGTIAAQLPSFWPILLVWAAGGAYAMLGALSIAELGTAMPQAGGFYIYARRAFGLPVGFAVGWADWLNNCAVIAYVAVAAAEYAAVLLPQLAPYEAPTALALLILVSTLQWTGLRLGSSIQKLTSSVTAIMLLLLAAACLLHPAPIIQQTAPAPHALPHSSLFALLVPIVAALRVIVVTYDGWYEAIYFTEEDTNVSRHLPRAMIGGVLLVTALYLLMNLAFLHVLSIPTLAASKLPAADAAQVVFPAGSATIITLLSLLALLSVMNAVMLGAPRILLAIGRDGLFSRRTAAVSDSGTPRPALLLTAATVAVFILSGRFEEIVAVAAIFVAALYCVCYLAVIRLRLREPQMLRPFRAWGYPFTTGLVLAGSIAFLIAAVHDDPISAARAVALLLIAAPVYLYRRRRLQPNLDPTNPV